MRVSLGPAPAKRFFLQKRAENGVKMLVAVCNCNADEPRIEKSASLNRWLLERVTRRSYSGSSGLPAVAVATNCKFTKYEVASRI